ncbi:uncharacterized protein BT62DRAFT_1013271 [Guyanagaster necrorhizus]|uniref:Uncharacterized protein n=1 Tax=Guyanagaster necrorhizus TaxID=856835 RepID=A0A9P7VH99_9AGAR|nr:uncharacterized protein BT62DRAFT_1013271 [Guyanagaster necrorhizus MCA 3950]KAG7439934.1 hypothetical protein BT62DRAFT_1013271 [Guyanagaster necrorhizus MCA 3950]
MRTYYFLDADDSRKPDVSMLTRFPQIPPRWWGHLLVRRRRRLVGLPIPETRGSIFSELLPRLYITTVFDASYVMTTPSDSVVRQGWDKVLTLGPSWYGDTRCSKPGSSIFFREERSFFRLQWLAGGRKVLCAASNISKGQGMLAAGRLRPFQLVFVFPLWVSTAVGSCSPALHD